jgi:bifunctional UDP-N-acetylglucosamine pyrophosphorylase/glucosamine-1-phosphate N-acetyltransferase
MNVKVIDIGSPVEMMPITCCRKFQEIPVAGITLRERLFWMFEAKATNGDWAMEIRPDFWPSSSMIDLIMEATAGMIITNNDGLELARLTVGGLPPEKTVLLDKESVHIKYPWDILAVNEKIVGAITKDDIQGTVRQNVVIDGIVHLGAGSILLPGVFIEGKVIIGDNCKIGPNCYLRGNTYIGDNCHVGQAVEIKNSLLMDKVSAGHLSYIGDSVICPRTNLGAGTITANLRHDGRNHSSGVAGVLLDTGRRKLGVIIGDNVHTGIHTSIYPGRKIWPEKGTVPGEIVRKDIKD